MPASTQELAYINGDILRWAIDRSRISRTSLAAAVGVSESELSQWESGRVPPPFKRAETLCDLLQIPFGYLYLEAPPADSLNLPDFRGRDSANAPSLNLVQVVRDVLMKQEWYAGYRSASGVSRLSFVGSFTADSEPSAVAADIRQSLNLANLRKKAASWSGYLTLLTRSAEEAGILVMRSSVVGNDAKRPLSAAEFRGFASVDQVAPSVFVNTADFKSAQIFTLAHELAHIWIGQSAVSNPDETKPAGNRIEAFCNAVAAETLVPHRSFVPFWLNTPDVDKAATHYRVSTIVILRRAFEVGQISKGEFFRLLEREQQRVEPEPRKQEGGPSYYRLLYTRMGKRLTDAVVREIHRGRLPYRDAAALLSVKLPTLAKFAEMNKPV